jgi:uncharacterized protein
MTGPPGGPSVPAGQGAQPGTPGARRPGASRQTRDRDVAGRPRNARPRDGLGRPLPRGQAGEERIPDDLAVPPDEALSLAQGLLDSGRPFHAHEVLEASWKAAPPAERELWKGLAQIAVGLTHARRGNATGAAALLRRGGQRVGGYAGAAPHGIDAGTIARQASSLADRIDADGLPAAAGDGAAFRLT